MSRTQVIRRLTRPLCRALVAVVIEALEEHDRRRARRWTAEMTTATDELRVMTDEEVAEARRLWTRPLGGSGSAARY